MIPTIMTFTIWQLEFSQGGTTKPTWSETITVTYPVSFKSRAIGGLASLVHDYNTSGSVAVYFKGKSISQGLVTHDSNDDGATAPLFYVVIGV